MPAVNFKNNWKEFFENKTSIYIFVFTVILLAIALNLFGKFLLFVEKRPGIVLQDPLFEQFKALDFNTPVFILIYGSLITGLVSLLPHPKYLLIALQAYLFMIIIRFIAMYLTPLEVPEGIINLRDPLVFTFGTGQVVTKDLFFSGHIASLTILFLTAQNKFLKWMFLVFALIVSGMIFLQKAHYTIDLVAAPFFAYAAHVIAKAINKKIIKNS
jgi:hypothetical protein